MAERCAVASCPLVPASGHATCSVHEQAVRMKTRAYGAAKCSDCGRVVGADEYVHVSGPTRHISCPLLRPRAKASVGAPLLDDLEAD